MLTETPTRTTTTTPTTTTPPKPAAIPAHRWSSMPAMSGLFRGGDPLFDLRDRIDRMFDGVFGDLAPAGWFGRGDMMPKMDVAETDKALTMTADLPGMEEKDVELTVADGVLTLSGERKSESDETDRNYRVVERSHGRFMRSFQLPDGVEVDKITARFDKGVLTVTLPKADKPAPEVKRIAIGNGEGNGAA